MAGTPTQPQPCVFYAQGKCRNGSACRFFHAEREELAKSPVPCRFFLQNACTAGRDCRFSHDPAHLRDPALIATTSAGERRVARQGIPRRCRFFDSLGGCGTGQQCMFQHLDGPVRSSPQPEPARASAVKMHVLRPKPKASDAAPAQPEGEGTQQDAAGHEQAAEQAQEEEEDADAETKQPAATGYDQQVAMLSDFLSKEEELYYYGAPGEFDMMTPSEPAGQEQQQKKMSYAEIASKYLDRTDSAQHAENADAKRSKPCVFFLQGLCRYGSKCFNAHEVNEAPASLEEQVLVEQEVAYSKDLECGICLERVMDKGERFGMLSNCEHAFCLSCVRNWRANPDMPKQTVRHCPHCRTPTHFVIPSSRMALTQSRKEELVMRYKANLALIPCRHFDQGRGECPFGTSCFYAHRYADGTEDLREVRTAIDSVGHHDVLRKIRLEHFFENLEV
ncbi:hypothetical protein P43SY_003727 [Pythium insidiosum]|uniref:RING-type E3 ubiquitin transferase n=1 Tax=Pythium insidiosum TaxID=114742 RepID=A0AAD5Q6B1_PYTIN|nr:hypothetical protein P43SY_003727 [Pythium insidiosum]